MKKKGKDLLTISTQSIYLGYFDKISVRDGASFRIQINRLTCISDMRLLIPSLSAVVRTTFCFKSKIVSSSVSFSTFSPSITISSIFFFLY